MNIGSRKERTQIGTWWGILTRSCCASSRAGGQIARVGKRRWCSSVKKWGGGPIPMRFRDGGPKSIGILILGFKLWVAFCVQIEKRVAKGRLWMWLYCTFCRGYRLRMIRREYRILIEWKLFECPFLFVKFGPSIYKNINI